MNRGKIRRRDRSDGTCRWYLDLGVKPWILCEAYSLPDKATRAKVEAWRATYLATMARMGADPTQPAGVETVSTYFGRWLKDRDRRGLTTTNDKGRFQNWIEPSIGHKPMATVTRRDLEEIVEKLDAAAVPGGSIRGKTARNIWGVCTKMFRDASASKVLALRVREDNPARDVAPPDKGTDRESTYLYPAEFAALVSCPRVPTRWRRLATLAAYTGMRRGEIEALDWADVRLEHGFIHVHAAVDEDGEIKSTKTGVSRKVPIEATLAPILAAMKEEAGGDKATGRVVGSMPPDEEMAKRLRKYLGWAGVKRAELFANDATRRHISWHDLRHTYACWRLIRGDNAKKVQRAGGWKTASMLDRYANEVETFEDLTTFGYPFPEVTGEVTGGPDPSPNARKKGRNVASPRGFEPLLAA